VNTSVITQLLAQIARLRGCSVRPTAVSASVQAFEQEQGVKLPDDLREFVTLCSGVSLFEDADCPIHVFGLDKIRRANPVLAGIGGEGHPSYTWFLIADFENGNYISIDLSPDRLGRCYESSWATHSLVGQSPVVATNFTDLLRRAVDNQGDYLWWLKESFESLGDAYDA
jgi:cell wall assembly regulator SMI1